ncbi:MAG: precorrin-8X methylmutase [Acidimicrobiales bacterium]
MPTHPIEAESYRILAERVDLADRDPWSRAVIERVIHASADVEYATSTIVNEVAVRRGIDALRAGAPVIADVEMVRAGITGHPTICLLGSTRAVPGGHPTRSAQAVRSAAQHYADGSIWVVGCAPTALSEILALVESGALRPALVIGMPVGFVGAAEAKAATRDLAARTGLAAITNVGEKGGSAVAAAAFNAVLRLSRSED